jgi:hypothetical protein
VDHDGVVGDSINGDGVVGISHTATRSGVLARNTNHPGGLAGFFDGDVVVTGSISGRAGPNNAVQFAGDIFVSGDIVMPAADCAEEFDLSATAEVDPGTVMVLTDSGGLEPSRRSYDRKVAGVISGAGEYRPGLILDKDVARRDRALVALVGKVYCRVDAQYGAIEVGDLLTTSPTLGHAMKASDPSLAFGAVIGKALRPLPSGQGLVPILIALQ